MLSLLKLLPPAARIEHGQALFNGHNLLQMNGKEIREVRGAQIGMIFQDPVSSLNPVINIGTQLSEPLQRSSENVKSRRLGTQRPIAGHGWHPRGQSTVEATTRTSFRAGCASG